MSDTLHDDKDRVLIEEQVAREPNEERYRERMLNLGMLDLVRAQEQLRQACLLARSAAAMLAELGARRDADDGSVAAYTLNLQAEIKLCHHASKRCQEALDLLDHQIAKAPSL